MLNNLIIIGRPTVEPELKETNGGVPVCTFSLACDRDYKGKDDKRQADFIRCVVYRDTAERIAKYVKKGKLVNLTGRIQSNTYEKEGKKFYVTELLVERFYLIAPKDDPSEEPAPDEVPF